MNSALTKVTRVSTWLAIAASAPVAWALSVSPPRTEVRLPPGGSTTVVLTVTNPHAVPYDVEVSQKPWFIYPENRAIPVEAWMKLPKTKTFRLKPGKSREVKVAVKCPKEAVGETMGMVSFAYQGTEPSQITPMISTALYLLVEGTEKNMGEILSLGAGLRKGRFEVGYQIQATGNVRLCPSGTIRLLDERGQAVAEYTFPEPNPVFPGTKGAYIGRGPDTAPKAGNYTLEAVIRSGTLELKKDQKIVVKENGDVT